MIRSLAKILDDLTDQNKPYYVAGSFIIISSTSYLGTTCLNLTGIISTSPLHGTIYLVTAFAIYHLTQHQFNHFFKPIEKDSLAPLALGLCKWTFSLFSAKMLLALLGIALSFSQITAIVCSCLIVLRIAHIVVNKLLKATSAPVLVQLPMRNN